MKKMRGETTSDYILRRKEKLVGVIERSMLSSNPKKMHASMRRPRRPQPYSYGRTRYGYVQRLSGFVERPKPFNQSKYDPKSCAE